MKNSVFKFFMKKNVSYASFFCTSPLRLFLIHSLAALQDTFSLLAFALLLEFLPLPEPGLRTPLSVDRPLSVIKISGSSSVLTTSSAFFPFSGLYSMSASAIGLLAGIPPCEAEGSVVS